MVELIKTLLKKYKELISYIIFGILTTIISLFVYHICIRTFLNPENALELQIANILSWTAGVIFAYITNRIYVFKSSNINKFVEISKFVSSRLVTLLLDMFIMYIGVTLLKFNNEIIKLFSQIIIIIGNYILSKIFVFKK